MSTDGNTRDKVIGLESDVKHLQIKVDQMSIKVSEMHDLLMKARGFRYAIIAAAGIGGFISAKLATFAQLIHWLPK